MPKVGEKLTPEHKAKLTREGTSKWCHLRYNETLRTAVKLRVKNYNLTEMCKSCGIHRNNFYKYLSGENCKRINQWQLVKVCKYLKINVTLKIEIE